MSLAQMMEGALGARSIVRCEADVSEASLDKQTLGRVAVPPVLLKAAKAASEAASEAIYKSGKWMTGDSRFAADRAIYGKEIQSEMTVGFYNVLKGLVIAEAFVSRSPALAESEYLKRPPRYPGPYTEQRLREILVDCQMRLAGAIQFAHGLVSGGVWKKDDHASFEREIDDAVKTVQDVYQDLGESVSEARLDDLERPVQDLVNMGRDLYRLCGRIESAAKRAKKVNPKLSGTVLRKIGDIDTLARKLSGEIDDIADVGI